MEAFYEKLLLVIGVLVVCMFEISYGEELVKTSLSANFDALTDLSSRYAHKKILDGKTTKVKKKDDEVFLEFTFDGSPYMFFANFVQNSPKHSYNEFIETIYYRDNIKIKDMYYEKNPVQTEEIGIYSTDLCFTSVEGIIYHYRNIPYLVSSDKPTVFFSEINFDEENLHITGEIKMPSSQNTYQIELFCTDNDEYRYQEAVANENGRFSFDLVQQGQVGKMYLKASDGLGNYANARDILTIGKTNFQISLEALEMIKASYQGNTYYGSIFSGIKLVAIRALLVLITLLFLLRIRVLVRRKIRRRKRYK